MRIASELITHAIRVVLADDHAVVRARIRKFLEQAGVLNVVGEASDGEMAVGIILRLIPDVAVLDISDAKSHRD